MDAVPRCRPPPATGFVGRDDLSYRTLSLSPAGQTIIGTKFDCTAVRLYVTRAMWVKDPLRSRSTGHEGGPKLTTVIVQSRPSLFEKLNYCEGVNLAEIDSKYQSTNVLLVYVEHPVEHAFRG